MRKKAELRTELKRRLRQMPADEKATASAQICQELRHLCQNHPEWQQIGVFQPFPSEPNIAPVFGELRQQRQLYFPQVIDDQTMELGKGVALDVVLVPALAVDHRGNRLGRSGGYYDRWLAAHPQPTRIGVVFSEQILPEVPQEKHDQALDGVISERGFTRFGRQNSKTSLDQPNESF